MSRLLLGRLGLVGSSDPTLGCLSNAEIDAL
jgi:hypothetical protein